MLLKMEPDNCSLRPCGTDFSIAAIMARHGHEKEREKHERRLTRRRASADSLLPSLGKIPPHHLCFFSPFVLEKPFFPFPFVSLNPTLRRHYYYYCFPLFAVGVFIFFSVGVLKIFLFFFPP